MMITASRAGGYQRDTDSVVGIERIGLSVFVLPQPHPVPLSAPAVCLIYSGGVRFDQVQVRCSELALAQLFQTQVLETDDIIALWML